MIEQVTIKNFKSLGDVTIQVDRLNIFVGMNGTGKTALLQSLAMVSKLMHDDRDCTGERHQVATMMIGYRLAGGGLLSWEGEFNAVSMQMARYAVRLDGAAQKPLQTAELEFRNAIRGFHTLQIANGPARIDAIEQATPAANLLMIDEVENGIGTELMARLANVLVNSPIQIMATTHSPLLLNYLDDDVARQAVQFVYQSPGGHTHIRRFFDIPCINDKLRYMGAGEAFVDTDLQALTDNLCKNGTF